MDDVITLGGRKANTCAILCGYRFTVIATKSQMNNIRLNLVNSKWVDHHTTHAALRRLRESSINCTTGQPLVVVYLRWLGTVLGRTKCANFFVKTCCLWHKLLENGIILGGHRAPFFRKWVRTLLFSTFLSME